jgi:hypothetical protein
MRRAFCLGLYQDRYSLKGTDRLGLGSLNMGSATLLELKGAGLSECPFLWSLSGARQQKARHAGGAFHSSSHLRGEYTPPPPSMRVYQAPTANRVSGQGLLLFV